MPSWKKIIVSGSNAVLSSVTASFQGNLTGTASFATSASFASTAPYSGLTGTVPTWNQNTTGNAATATTASFASTAPYSGLTGTVPTWNQNTTGNAATATTASFASTAPYSGLTGTVPTWNQNTTGNAATATTASFAPSASNARSAITASTADDFFVRGNVGIGTAASGNRLEVQGGGRFNNALQLFGGSAGNSPRLILGGETSNTDKSIFLESFFMVFQGHDNEGFKFNTTTSAGVVSTRMVILGSGNVGIGTGTPFGTATNRTVLSVNGTTDVSLNIGSGGTQRAYLYAASTYAEIGTIGSLPLTFAPNNSEKMRLTSDGNLGIGTTSPSENLHVIGSGLFSGAVTATQGLRSNRTSDALSGMFLRSTIDGSTITNNGIILGKTNSSNDAATIVYTHLSDGSTSNRLGFGFWANDNLVNILASGNVGISTTAPKRLFSVRSLNNDITPIAGFYALNETQGVEIWYGGIIMSGSNTDVSLSLSPKGSGSTNIPIGNVGIGTTNPSNKLQVVGGVTATSFTGSLFGTASFAVTASHAQRAKLADSASYALVTYEDQPSQGAQYWPTIATTYGTEYTGLLSDSRLSYFTDNGTLFSPSFSGSFTGSISNATSASFAPNFANTNLSLNDNRTHNLNSNSLTFTATEDESIVFNHSSGGTFEINGSPTIQTTGVIQHQGSGYFTGNIGIGTSATTTARLHVSASTGNIIRATAAGSDILVVSSSGNVGIGTSTFYQTLTVNKSNSGGAGGYLRLENTVGGAGANVGVDFATFSPEFYSAGTAPVARIFATDIDNYSGRLDINLRGTGVGGTLANVLTAHRSTNVGIGSTSPAQKLDVNGAIKATLANTNQANAVMYNSGTGLLTYVSTGSIGVGTATNADNIFVSEDATNAAQPVLFASNTEGYYRARGDKADFTYNPATNILTAGAFVETSAIKYKENIVNLTSSLYEVEKLQGVTYNRIGQTHKEIGFIADDIVKIYPELVNYQDGEVYGLSYNRLTAVLVEAVKELSCKVKEQEIFIKDLAHRLKKLEDR